MYICLCNGLTDSQVRRAAAAPEAGSVSRVYRELGCAPRCGKCVSMVRQMVEDAADAPGSPSCA